MTARNTLTDEEVAIIKNLIARKTSNKVIAGLVNRARGDADTDISPGRISNIKNDEIQKYISIKPASNKVADDFIEKAKTSAPALSENNSPLSDKVLDKLLLIKKGFPLSLSITETDQIECKESFNLVPKTTAAFANNKGGYFVFGVKDKSWEVVGLNDEKINKFNTFDLKDYNQRILKNLSAHLDIQKRVYEIADKKVGIIYIAPAIIKPAIIVNGDDDMASGHIYYRYAGEDRLITAVDLQKIIEERIRQLSETILMKQISNLFKFGLENAAILNTATGEVSGTSGNFLIDESILPQLTFINEGKFVETDGAPTLKLIGDVHPVSTVRVDGSFKALNDEMVIKDFIEQKTVFNPQEYIKYLMSTQIIWLPIYYFMHQAKIDAKEAALLLESVGIKKHRLNVQKQRLSGKKKIPTQVKRSSYAAEIRLIANKASLKGMPKKNLSRCFQAILHLKKDEVELDCMLELLKDTYKDMYAEGNQNTQSIYRYAICKIDELFFKL